jgi:cell division protein FtsZ
MVQALEPMKSSPARAPLAVKPRPPMAEPMSMAIQPQLETQVQQAVAEAIQHQPTYSTYEADDGITVEPYIPAASLDALDEPIRVPEAPVPQVHVPSNAVRPELQRRMPRTEELPPVARRTLAAEERHEAEPRNARALFKRLASNVGLGLRPQHHPGLAQSSADDAAARSAIEAGPARNAGSSGAPEGAKGGLDPHGRQQAQKEHIEIPSFLRKHG